MKKILVISSTVIAILTGGILAASQADQNSQTIYACTTAKQFYIIRVSYQPVNCPQGTTPIQWGTGSQGAPGVDGAKGDTGPMGPQGPKGDTGEKGDAGYSYEQALAGINSSSSATFSLNFGSTNRSGAGCVGLGFSRIVDGSVNYCYKTISNATKLNILSVKSSPSNGVYPDAGALYLVSGTCPSTRAELQSLENANRPAIYLVSDQKPVSYTIADSTSCLMTVFHAGYQSQSGMYQVIASTTN